MKNCLFFCVVLLSPSSRAEWVEMSYIRTQKRRHLRLRPRGRSGLKSYSKPWIDMPLSLRPRGRSGLKSRYNYDVRTYQMSPSSRAEWVEIFSKSFAVMPYKSPSSRAEWVEISTHTITYNPHTVSVLAGGVG